MLVLVRVATRTNVLIIGRATGPETVTRQSNATTTSEQIPLNSFIIKRPSFFFSGDGDLTTLFW
jgi:hypothetical protein